VNGALIGYGYWGQRFLPYLDNEFNIRYVFSPSLVNDGRFINDINRIWEDDKVELVVITTPIDTHYQMVKDAVIHGKHVLCEKPLSQDSKQVLELLGLAGDRELHLVTEYTYTFSRSIQKAQSLVKRGIIGELQAMELSLRYLAVDGIAKNEKFSKYSVYWLLATHLLSVLDMFSPLGDLKFDKVDLVQETGCLLFDGCIKGMLSVSFNYPTREAEVVIYGKTGTIVCDLLHQPTLHYVTYERVNGGLANAITKEEKGYTFDEGNNLAQASKYFKKAIIEGFTNLEYRDFWVTNILEKLNV
jgi:predicted dehydrogenase